MISFRKYVYAGLVLVTSLNISPTQAAAAEKARGKFTLTHEVHWQNALLPAGDYKFSLDSDGVAGTIVLSKISGSAEGFLLMVHSTDENIGSGPGRLVLESTSQGTYVSAMRLPEYGFTLRFKVPSPAEKQIATLSGAPGSTQ